MSRLTLRLPNSLHNQLRSLANNDDISLNQYVVYALTHQVTLAYTTQAFSDKAIAQQQAAYTALLQGLGQASFEEIQQVMDERNIVKPEKGLNSDVINKLQSRIHSQQLAIA